MLPISQFGDVPNEDRSGAKSIHSITKRIVAIGQGRVDTIGLTGDDEITTIKRDRHYITGSRNIQPGDDIAIATVSTR